jgi:hypothetical protein
VLHALFMARSGGKDQEFVHTTNGYIVRDEGVWPCEGETVGVIPDTFALNTIGWATGLLNQPVHEHHIAAYEARLYTARSFRPDPELPVFLRERPLGIQRPELFPPASFLIPELDFFSNPVVDVGPRGPQDDRDATPRDRGDVASRILRTVRGPYYASRIRKRSYVFWNDQPLFGPYGAKTARKIAGRMNSVAARYNAALQSDNNALIHSVSNVFTGGVVR